MYFLLKFFDRYTWVKRLSFLGKLDAEQIAFEKFVLDTRYTLNLLFLTVGVSVIGLVVYVFVAWLLRSYELKIFVGLVKRFLSKSTALREPITGPDADSIS